MALRRSLQKVSPKTFLKCSIGFGVGYACWSYNRPAIAAYCYHKSGLDSLAEAVDNKDHGDFERILKNVKSSLGKIPSYLQKYIKEVNLDDINFIFLRTVANGDIEALNIIEKYFNVNWTNLDAYSVAIKGGNLKMIQHVEEKYSKPIDYQVFFSQKDNIDAFTQNVIDGHVDVIEYLIEKDTTLIPLCSNAFTSNEASFKYFFDSHLIEKMKLSKNTFLSLLNGKYDQSNYDDSLDKLLIHYKELKTEQKTEILQSVLDYYCSNTPKFDDRIIPMLTKLIKFGASPKEIDLSSVGETHKELSIDILKLMVDNKADYKKKDVNGETLLFKLEILNHAYSSELVKRSIRYLNALGETKIEPNKKGELPWQKASEIQELNNWLVLYGSCGGGGSSGSFGGGYSSKSFCPLLR